MKNILSLNNNYSLEQTNNSDGYLDFNILHKNNNIGILQLRVYDEVFIRQIRIEEPFRRKGHAKNIIDNILKHYKKPVSLCVATSSQSAIDFWGNYLNQKKEVRNIKGNVYKIYG